MTGRGGGGVEGEGGGARTRRPVKRHTVASDKWDAAAEGGLFSDWAQNLDRDSTYQIFEASHLPANAKCALDL